VIITQTIPPQLTVVDSAPQIRVTE
jgi:hypothetical protein